MAIYTFRELVIDSRTGLNPRKNFTLGNGNNYYITIKDIHDGKIVITDKTDRVDDDAIAIIKKRSRIKKGDILFTSIGRIGETAIVTDKDDTWDVNESVFIFTLNTDLITQEFFSALFQSKNVQDQLTRDSSGSTFKSIKMNQLEKMSFDIPSLEEQKKISNVLRETNKLISLRKEQLAKLDRLVKSRFIELFGDPVYNNNGLPTKKLHELGSLDRGRSQHRPRNDSKLLNGPYPLIQTGEVTSAGLYITEYKNTYSELGLQQSKMWKAGTLCITIAANIAQTAILTFDACFPDSVVGFVPNDSVSAIYMHYWFGFFQKILEEQAPQVAQKNINLKILSDLDVMVPTKEQQEQFAAFVEQTDKSKLAIQKSLDKLELLKKSLMQQYFG